MSGRKNKFSKAMTHLKSGKIDEKIGYLNKEMKKAGVISEVMGNTTSDLYCTTEYIPPVPESPTEYTDVPDPEGVRSDGWTQPSNGYDASDPATWENAFDDFSWLYNPNDVAGETNRPVVKSVNPDWSGAAPGGGMIAASVNWGMSLGYVTDAGIYKPMITSNLFGSIVPPTDNQRNSGGQYRNVSDEQWAQMQSLWAAYQSPGLTSKSISCWFPWSYFHNGPWDSYSAPKRSDYHILINGGFFTNANEYVSKPHENEIPGRTVVLTQHSLDDGNFYPGNPNGFMDFLRNALDAGQEALDWLMDAAGEVVDAAEDLFAGEDLSDQEKQEATDISEKPPGVVQSALENLKDALDGSIDAFKDWKGFDGKGWTMAEKAEWVSDMASQIGTAGKVYISYLSGGLEDGSIDNDFLGADYVNNAFANADINQDGNIVVGDNVIGSGGAPSYDPSTGEVTIPFNYDFDTNQEQIMKDPDKYDVNASVLTAAGMVSAWILGGAYGLDSVPVPGAGYATWLAKSVGSAQPTTGHGITMSLDELRTVNPYLVQQLEYQGIITEGISLSEGWESPKHTYIDKDQQKRWFKEKDVAPVYPKKAPPKMMNGYHPDLLPKLGTEDTPLPQIKVRKKDLLRGHNLKKDEAQKLIDIVDRLNDYIKRNPDHLAYARERYPKSDPRLAALNYKMDMQIAAADEYVEKHFPENKRLLNKVLKATKRSIKLTDPKTFKSEDGVFTTFNKLERARHFDNEYKPKDRKVLKKRRGKSVGRFFYKPKKKSKYDILKDKMVVLDKEMKKMMPDT